MNYTEEQLLKRLQRGDKEAFRQLFRSHYSTLCRFAMQLLHDKAAAETIADDVFFAIWQNRTSLSIGTSMRSYLFSAIRNRCINEIDSMRRRPSNPGSGTDYEAEQDLLAHVFADDHHPLGMLIEKELEGEIARCVEELPQDCRRVFKMSRCEQMSYSEIAERLGISVNTVKYHMKAALRQLHGSLGDYLKVLVLLFLAR